MKKSDPEISSRGVADMLEETVEVLCDALDCFYNDKSRESVASEGFCKHPSLKMRKGSCVCYKMDKEWMKYSLRRHWPRVIFPRKFNDKTTWSEG